MTASMSSPAEQTMPYRVGRCAFEENKELSDNPHAELSDDWFDWRQGWYDASDADWERRRAAAIDGEGE